MSFSNFKWKHYLDLVALRRSEKDSVLGARNRKYISLPKLGQIEKSLVLVAKPDLHSTSSVTKASDLLPLGLCKKYKKLLVLVA